MATRKNLFVKDPGAIEWFGVDWSDRLAGDDLWAVDTIASSDWTVPAGLTEVSDLSTSSAAGVKLSGGTAGTIYSVVNQVVTAVNTETLQQTIEIFIQEV